VDEAGARHPDRSAHEERGELAAGLGVEVDGRVAQAGALRSPLEADDLDRRRAQAGRRAELGVDLGAVLLAQEDLQTREDVAPLRRGGDELLTGEDRGRKTLAVTSCRPGAAAATLAERSAIPARSASVSPGKPSMK
jgi:hypothetical protein